MFIKVINYFLGIINVFIRWPSFRPRAEKNGCSAPIFLSLIFTLNMEKFSHDELIEIQTKRGGGKILYKGFSYKYKKDSPNKVICRCSTSGYNSYLQIDNEMTILGIAEHLHEENFEKKLQGCAYRTILKRSEETSELSREIIYKTLKDYNGVEVWKSPLLSPITDQIKKIQKR